MVLDLFCATPFDTTKTVLLYVVVARVLWAYRHLRVRGLRRSVAMDMYGRQR